MSFPPPHLQFILSAVDLNTKLGKFKWKKCNTENIYFLSLELNIKLGENLKLRNIKGCSTVKCLPQTFRV